MEKYGFVYIWYDKKRNMFYIGSHWGTEDDGYVCSSNWMRDAYRYRPQDFKRRIVTKVFTNRVDLLKEEERWLSMIKDEEMVKANTTYESRKNVKYYNISKVIKNPWHMTEEGVKTIGQKISHSKKGKSVPAPPERGAAISAAKKGKALTEEHKEALRGIKKKPHTDEWKKNNSTMMKKTWANDEERKRKHSERMKKRWEEYRLNKSLDKDLTNSNFMGE